MSELQKPAWPPPVTRPDRLAHPFALFAFAGLVAAVLATAVGLGVAFAAGGLSATNCSPSDGWCGLGAVLVGVVAGTVTAAIVYVVTGVITITRHRPSGRRWRHVVAHLLAPLAVGIVLSALAGIVNALT